MFTAAVADIGKTRSDTALYSLLAAKCGKIAITTDTNAPAAFAPADIVVIRDGGAAEVFGLIEQIRSVTLAPMLVLSDRCDEIYRSLALSKGADICISWQETGTLELDARLCALLRRADETCEEPAPELTNGVISVDPRRRTVTANGSLIRMTATEYGILEYLLTNCGTVCPIEDIYRNVWHEMPYGVKKTVVEHIRRIRRKVEPDPHNPSYIKAVFGVGYKIEDIRGA